MEKNTRICPVDNYEYTKWRNGTLSSKVETDKKYMILSLSSHVINTAGLGWYIFYTLLGIRTAIANGYIPVVDWKNRKFPQYKASIEGMENIWEYYFEQPYNIGLGQANTTDNSCYIDDVTLLNDYKGPSVTDFINFCSNGNKGWRNCFKDYVRLNVEVKDEFNLVAKDILDGAHTLGILYRGTDYTELKPLHHPRAIELGTIFQETDTLLEQGLFDRVFVATEDQAVLDKFVDRYKEKVCYVNAPRYSDVGRTSLNQIHIGENNGKYRDKQYLCSLYILAQCDGVIYTPCGGSIISTLMRKEEGEYYHFHYQGNYAQKCYIIGSRLEEEAEQILYAGHKPLMYYALNTMRLLSITDITIVTTEQMICRYKQLIQCGQKWGISVRYLVKDNNENIVTVLMKDVDNFQGESVCIIREDNIFHWNGCIGELKKRAVEFDGAYIWGIKKGIAVENEMIYLNQKSGMPEFASYDSGLSPNYRGIVGLYFFDYEFSNILCSLFASKKNVTLADIENVYIQKRKLIYSDLKRGMIWAQIECEESLKQISACIDLLEEQFGLSIGDIEQFTK